jgi:hypothetical protein
MRQIANSILFGDELPGGWILSSSSDEMVLAIVDGLGPFSEYGPHYSRRNPGSNTFTGVGREVVLLHCSNLAVFASILQMTPAKKGSGCSRGRNGKSDENGKQVWRNMLFRRLPECPVIASKLVRTATEATYIAWMRKYGELPKERLRTEVDIRKIKSDNPGYCYKLAGYTKDRIVRGKLYLWAPQ